MLEISIDKIRRATSISDLTLNEEGDKVGDEQILSYISDAQTTLEAKTGLKFEETTKNDMFDGDGTGTIKLTKYPVVNITSLTIDDVEVEDLSVTPTDPENFVLYRDSGVIKLLNSLVFTSGTGNIKATYTYYNSGKVDLAKTAIFYMACISVLIDVGNYLSEGAKTETFDDYKIDYSGGPYDGAIKKFQMKLGECYQGLGVYKGIIVV